MISALLSQRSAEPNICERSALALCLKAGLPPSSRKKDINELHAQLPSVEVPTAAK
jgi:hypothetical protein